MRRVAAVCGALAMSVLPTGPAFGDDPWARAVCPDSANPQCDFSVGSTSQATSVSKSTMTGPGSDARVCREVPLSLVQGPQIVDDGGSDPQGVFQEVCTVKGQIVSTQLIFYSAAASTSAAHSLALSAYKSLVMPAPQAEASPRLDIPQLTGLPMWLFLKPGSWMPKSATVSAGGVTVTATATPQSVAWDLGDGSTVTCSGPGTPYRLVPRSDGLAASPDCGHTYRRTSAAEPNGVFDVTATINWKVVWTGFGPGGTFPNLKSSVHLPVKVVESAALVSSSHS